MGHKRCGRASTVCNQYRVFHFPSPHHDVAHRAAPRVREQCMFQPHTGNTNTTGSTVDTTVAVPRVLDISLDAVGSVEQGDGVALAGLCTGMYNYPPRYYSYYPPSFTPVPLLFAFLHSTFVLHWQHYLSTNLYLYASFYKSEHRCCPH